MNPFAIAATEFVNPYRLNPYVQFVENHIFPNFVQHGVLHRLTGEVIEPLPNVRVLLFALKVGSPLSFSDDDVARMGDDGRQLRSLIEKKFLLTGDQDPLAAFVDQYVVRPKQNPAVWYRSETGELMMVRTSMARRIFSPAADELPKVIVEILEPNVASLYLAADGTRTLSQICETIPVFNGKDLLANDELRNAIDFLTGPARQLIKFTRSRDEISNPFQPCNIVPRNMYPSARSKAGSVDVIDFHEQQIDDASREFDFVEPTINHAFRYPSEAMEGLNYGARFFQSALDLAPRLKSLNSLNVLEVGGGTGSFAATFIEEARRSHSTINYQIVDLSPALMKSQTQLASSHDVTVTHLQQDATQLSIPGRKFDLIISNEVIADFPVSPVYRNANDCQGPGAEYLKKYNLEPEGAPGSFLLNTGAIQFLERAWEHLSAGGAFLVSEYGDELTYPIQAYHLNHEEFSIHFGHLKKCAEQIGFECRLMSLKDFLRIDDQVSMLDGQEEQILCLNHVFEKYRRSLPFALISEREFYLNYGDIVEQTALGGVTFSPLSNGFHFGPKLSDFMILVMTKPSS